MIKICALLLLVVLSQSHIYSSDSRITYDYDGNPRIYHLFLALEMGLGSDDYLKIVFPTKIHTASLKSALTVKLISFSNNLEIVDLNFPTAMDNTDKNYYISFGVSLTANKWYEIQIFPNLVPAETFPYFGLIQIQALSSTDSRAIVYDSNMGFGYISIEGALVSTGNLGVVTTSPVAA